MAVLGLKLSNRIISNHHQERVKSPNHSMNFVTKFIEWLNYLLIREFIAYHYEAACHTKTLEDNIPKCLNSQTFLEMVENLKKIFNAQNLVLVQFDTMEIPLSLATFN